MFQESLQGHTVQLAETVCLQQLLSNPWAPGPCEKVLRAFRFYPHLATFDHNIIAYFSKVIHQQFCVWRPELLHLSS